LNRNEFIENIEDFKEGEFSSAGSSDLSPFGKNNSVVRIESQNNMPFDKMDTVKENDLEESNLSIPKNYTNIIRISNLD